MADISGRSITYLAIALVQFWGLHRDNLVGSLPAAAVSALDALAAALPGITAINPEGPL